MSAPSFLNSFLTLYYFLAIRIFEVSFVVVLTSIRPIRLLLKIETNILTPAYQTNRSGFDVIEFLSSGETHQTPALWIGLNSRFFHRRRLAGFACMLFNCIKVSMKLTQATKPIIELSNT